MAKAVINRGSSANDGSGDNLRAGALKINSAEIDMIPTKGKEFWIYLSVINE